VGKIDYHWPLYGTLSGYVYDETTNFPLKKVIIKTRKLGTIKKDYTTVITDENGYFSLRLSWGTMGPKPTEQNYNDFPTKFFENILKLIFEKLNYQPQEITVLVKLKVFLLPEGLYTKHDHEAWEENIFKEKQSEIPHTNIPIVYLKTQEAM
jgi:hypothetical protein